LTLNFTLAENEQIGGFEQQINETSGQSIPAFIFNQKEPGINKTI
jgi:hypothetical protein